MATPHIGANKEALKKVEDQLECAICLHPYTDPKLLPCFHVYCKHCLEHLVVQDRDGPTVTCPKCCQPAPVPPNGITGLQSAFHVHNLCEIRDALEKAKVPRLVPNDIEQMCQKYGTVVAEEVDPTKCYATGDGLKAATIGREATVTLHTVNTEGRECQEPVKDLAAELVFCKDGTVVKCCVKQERKSVYGIRYQPVTRGKHQLHITIKGKQTKGSPHMVAVSRPPLDLGNPIRTIGNLKDPWGIVTDSKGRIIVAERVANCVSIFTPEGERYRSFETYGTANVQFSTPLGVTVDSDDNIYGVDNGNHRIQKFTPDGEFIATAGSYGSNSLQFINPVGIGYNSKNDKLYVCDQLNHRIQILERSLAYSSTFGSNGSRDGQFNYPWGVGFDTTGNVYIADYYNHSRGTVPEKVRKQGERSSTIEFPI